MDAEWRYWHAVGENFDFLVERVSTSMERARDLSQSMFAKGHLTFDEHLYILDAIDPQERIEKLLICLLKRKIRFQRTYIDLAREVDEDVSTKLAHSLRQLEKLSVKPKPRNFTPLFGLDLSATFRAYSEDINICESRADQINSQIEPGDLPTKIMFADYAKTDSEWFQHNRNFAIASVSEGGGLLRLRDGSASLSVPAGAFSSYPQLICIYKYHETFTVDTIEYSLPIIRCFPDDLSFDIPATLTFAQHNPDKRARKTIFYRKQTENWKELDLILNHYMTTFSNRCTFAAIIQTGEYTVVGPSDPIRRFLEKGGDNGGTSRSEGYPSVDIGSESVDHDRRCYQLYHSKSDPSMIKISTGPLSAIRNKEETPNDWSTVSQPKPLPREFSAVRVYIKAENNMNCNIKNYLVQTSLTRPDVDDWIIAVRIVDRSLALAMVDLLIYAETKDSLIYQSTLIFTNEKPPDAVSRSSSAGLGVSGVYSVLRRVRSIQKKTKERSFSYVEPITDLTVVGYISRTPLLAGSLTSSLVIRSAISDIAYAPAIYRSLANSVGIDKEIYNLMCQSPNGHRDVDSKGMIAFIDAYCAVISTRGATQAIQEFMSLAAVALPVSREPDIFLRIDLPFSWKLIHLLPVQDALFLLDNDISEEDRDEIYSIENPILRMMWLLQLILLPNRYSYDMFNRLFRYFTTLIGQEASVLIADLPQTQHINDEMSRMELESEKQDGTSLGDDDEMDDSLFRKSESEDESVADVRTFLFESNRTPDISDIINLPTFASAEVSSETGGLLRLSDNSASISIPPSAFKQPVQHINLLTHYENRRIGKVDRSLRIVRCEPDGIEFDLPVCVSFTYQLPADSDEFEIYFRSLKTQGSWRKIDKSECFYTINIKIGLVTMHVTHFSEYMIVPLTDTRLTDSEITNARPNCLRVYTFEQIKYMPDSTMTASIIVCVVNSIQDLSNELRAEHETLGYTMSCKSRCLPDFHTEGDITVAILNCHNCEANGATQQKILAADLKLRDIPRKNARCFVMTMTDADEKARFDVSFLAANKEGPIYGIKLCVDSRRQLQIPLSVMAFRRFVAPLFNRSFLSADGHHKLERAHIIGYVSGKEPTPGTIDSLIPHDMKVKMRPYIERNWRILAKCIPENPVDVDSLEEFCRGKIGFSPGICVIDELEQQCVTCGFNREDTLTYLFEILLVFSIKTRKLGPITDTHWRYREAILQAKDYVIEECGIPSVPDKLASKMFCNGYISNEELQCVVKVSRTNTQSAKMETLLEQLTTIKKVNIQGIFCLTVEELRKRNMNHVTDHLESKFEDASRITESHVVQQMVNVILIEVFSNHLPRFDFDGFMEKNVYSHHATIRNNS